MRVALGKVLQTHREQLKMAIKPVKISKAYRLVQLGSTTMISAEHNGDSDVMAAAWVGLGGPNKIIAYIGTQAYTRKLVEQSGYFLVHIPTVQQMETVLYVGEHSKYTMPNKLDNLDLFYQPECAIPLVVGSAGYLLCQVIPNQHQEQNFDSFMAKLCLRGQTTVCLTADIGYLTPPLMSSEPCIMSLEVSFMRLAKALNLTTGQDRIKRIKWKSAVEF